MMKAVSALWRAFRARPAATGPRKTTAQADSLERCGMVCWFISTSLSPPLPRKRVEPSLSFRPGMVRGTPVTGRHIFPPLPPLDTANLCDDASRNGWYPNKENRSARGFVELGEFSPGSAQIDAEEPTHGADTRCRALLTRRSILFRTSMAMAKVEGSGGYCQLEALTGRLRR